MSLEEALTIFDELGAARWAEKARAELAQISGRAPSKGGLTPAEERVAALVAKGKTNKEVAAELFVADRTVEYHLSHIYAKLGVRSRAELARRPPRVAGSKPCGFPRSRRRTAGLAWIAVLERRYGDEVSLITLLAALALAAGAAGCGGSDTDADRRSAVRPRQRSRSLPSR